MRKTNNKGFSMTEVIVAVAVFLILAIPILSQLALSAKNNSKAKASQYGINVAESEMELLKAVDLNAIAKIYNKTETKDPTTGVVTETIYTLPDKYVVDGDVVESVFMTSPYATPSLLEFVDRVREITMDQDGKFILNYTQTVSNKKFDVQVTLDPKNYDGKHNDTGADDPSELSYNSPKDGAVQNLNKEEQAIIGSNMNALDEEARDDFWEDWILSGLTYQQETMFNDHDQLPSNYQNYSSFDIFRTIYITIEENTDTATISKGKYKVSTSYVYECKYKVAGVWKTWSNTYYDASDAELYYNTVPDIKLLYNQVIVRAVGTKERARNFIDKGNDAIVFTNKLPYAETYADTADHTGYTYFYTNSDLYLVFNNGIGVGGARAYYDDLDCTISFGAEHHATQKAEGLNVYYSQTDDSADRSILNNLKIPSLLSSYINVQSADKKVVQQDFQPIYDISITVTPTNGNGMSTKMEGTRGQ
ncbi:MAG: prepilin-type N-terminal cleavage/methylation domain-containing protein [Lachnospiraceae bacterium]|nr:prepilin-type N-terminal cleavage/methylation domain-containing protein [Lachnospiraceae bacterium]